MLAICKTEPVPGGITVQEVLSLGEPTGSNVRLRVEAAGICGTDLLIYKWGGFAHRMMLPTVLGHEISGVVEAIGPGVTRVAVGDRVSVESHLPCGRCYTCNRGWSHVCPNTRYPGVDFHGGFASHVMLPEQVLFPVPGDVGPLQAAMMEPFGIAVHASQEGSGVSGLNVLISGCGPIGLMNVAVAKALGANRIVALDINPLRLRAAETMGADVTIDVSKGSAAHAVTQLTRGRGMDVAIDYSAQAGSIDALEPLITHGGELRLLGVPSEPVPVNLDRWLFKGLVVRSLHGRRLFSSWETATRLLIDGHVDLLPLVSHRLPISDALKGFDAALRGDALKVIFEPNGPADTPPAKI
ncbi:alcohol dehydrogenase catalytic domain-containing protein [Sphingobium aquiterrae]|jgi:threonine 3-dehydrogenase|uniref:alcohol dehydrogenase catalytic domain-containing protein n=1 Tax=Sphingobium aquiterrae TaxID=2038656 RepID=UPI003018AE04|tara:strand:- start:14500 stop:15564 length:1065 start_codon:yes stop_codon:yes gene_type:complete